MIFTNGRAELVMSGQKTQTRRPVKPGDLLRNTLLDNLCVCRVDDVTTIRYITMRKTYAVQPGRGKAAIGRIRLLDIRREDVRNISGIDARAEGFGPAVWPCAAFLNVWTAFYDKEANDALRTNQTGAHWQDYLQRRPAALYDAWALTFEVVK